MKHHKIKIIDKLRNGQIKGAKSYPKRLHNRTLRSLASGL